MESFNLAIRLPIGTQEFNNCTIDDAIGIMQTKLWEHGVSDILTDTTFWDYVMARYRNVPSNILRALYRINVYRTTAIKV
jgi:hypothetical protein